MAEEFGDPSRYDVTGPIGPASSQGKMLRLVGDGTHVLDVGCASGYLARELTARGCRVVGIEHDRALAAKAREHCEDVVEGDLETMDLKEALGERSFDTIVCGDILEHLRDPVRVLDQLRGQLNPGGYLVASVPNVAHASVRLSLVTGKFEYADLGLLDRTHLRFYTRHSLVEMLADGGFTTVHIDPVRKGVDEADPQPDENVAVPPLVRRFVDADPDAAVFQFVVLAYPAQAIGATGIPALLHRLYPQGEELARLRLNRDQELEESRAKTEAAFAQLLEARDDVLRKEAQLATLRRELEIAEFGVESARDKLDALESVREELAKAQADRDSCLAAIQEIHDSTTWRLMMQIGRLRGRRQ